MRIARMSTNVPQTHLTTSNTPYTIRTATRDDVQIIDNCNRANLPENYGLMFYYDHLRRWPDLSLLAFDEKNEMMGYALGRLELVPSRSLLPLPFKKPSYIGHVASIAVFDKYRGLGVGGGMMRLLQEGFATYDIDSVNLYCRTSNANAIRMYGQLQYSCSSTVKGYYMDGEDACLMTLEGLKTHSSAPKLAHIGSGNSGNSGSGSGSIGSGDSGTLSGNLAGNC